MTIEAAHKVIRKRRETRTENLITYYKEFRNYIAENDDIQIAIEKAKYFLQYVENFEKDMEKFNIEENVLIALETKESED